MTAKKLSKRVNNRASFTLGYALLVVMIVTASTWLFYYLKGAVAGRWQDAIETTFGYVQYEPGQE